MYYLGTSIFTSRVAVGISESNSAIMPMLLLIEGPDPRMKKADSVSEYHTIIRDENFFQ